ncbi:CobW family GTP-binding protein [Pelagibius sp.]|uniref:CobW family GTP-binding protein n=1 Tax=Pelagibius sp. TaxID=1931238 RepID=UPI003B512DCB
MESWDSTASHQRLPVSLLTGFLGSGKTTLLNHLVQQPELAKTLVIINEFGETGLDHELVERSSEDMVLLQSGCLCCTIRSDLIDTMRSLFLRRVRGEIPEFDRVVIETTGLADPAPILHTLMTDPLIAARYRLDGVITTIDAANGQQTLDRQVESVKQAAVADRLLLTKTDLVEPDAVAALIQRLSALNPGAPVIRTINGTVDPAKLLDAGLYNPKTKSLDVRRWLNAEAFSNTNHHHHEAHHEPHHDHGHGVHHGTDSHDHHHDVNRHDDHIKAVCLTLDDPIPGDSFDRWLEALLLLKGPDVLRVKGIVNIQGLKGPFVVHGVQHIFHPPVMLKKWPGKDRRTRIVFITRDLDETALRNTLKIFTTGPESVEQPVQLFGPEDSTQTSMAQFEDRK